MTTENNIHKQYENIEKANANYLTEFDELIKNVHKLLDYVKPLIKGNKEQEKVVGEITARLLTLPISHMVLNTIHMTNILQLREFATTNIPKLKIECPDCKKVVWDVTEFEDFLKQEFKGEKCKTNTQEKK